MRFLAGDLAFLPPCIAGGLDEQRLRSEYSIYRVRTIDISNSSFLSMSYLNGVPVAQNIAFEAALREATLRPRELLLGGDSEMSCSIL